MLCVDRMSLPAVPAHWRGIVLELYCSPRLCGCAYVVSQYSASLGAAR